MLAAFATSSLFLRRATSSTTRRSARCRFTRQGFVRPLYFSILITHVMLAAAVLPLALVTLSRGLQGRYPRTSRDRPLDAADLALRVGDRRARLRAALPADLAALIRRPRAILANAGYGFRESRHALASLRLRAALSRLCRRAAARRRAPPPSRAASAASSRTRTASRSRAPRSPRRTRTSARQLHGHDRRQGALLDHRAAAGPVAVHRAGAGLRRRRRRDAGALRRRPNPPITFTLRKHRPGMAGALGGIAGEGPAGAISRAADALFNQQKWDEAIAAYRAIVSEGAGAAASSTCRSPRRTGTRRTTTPRSRPTTSC